MKHVRKTQPEPPCLTAVRDATPDADWQEFRETTCYEVVKNQTAADQGGLCAYCERLLGAHDRQIAHFHPKSDRPARVNWGLHWPNLWFACRGGDQAWMGDPEAFLKPASENRSCDVAKEDKIVDGTVLAPDEIPAFPRVFRYEQRTDGIDIVPDRENCEGAEIDVGLASASIDTYNLNCRRLSEARMRVHRAIEAQIKRLRERSLQPEHHFSSLVERHLGRSVDGNWKPFFTMVRWRFGETAEKYLRSIDYQG